MKIYEVKSEGDLDCWVVAKTKDDAISELKTSTGFDYDDEIDYAVTELAESYWDSLFVYESEGPDEIHMDSKKTFREAHNESGGIKPYIIAHSMTKY